MQGYARADTGAHHYAWHDLLAATEAENAVRVDHLYHRHHSTGDERVRLEAPAQERRSARCTSPQMRARDDAPDEF
jgi:hypothetical protein